MTLKIVETDNLCSLAYGVLCSVNNISHFSARGKAYTTQLSPTPNCRLASTLRLQLSCASPTPHAGMSAPSARPDSLSESRLKRARLDTSSSSSSSLDGDVVPPANACYTAANSKMSGQRSSSSPQRDTDDDSDTDDTFFAFYSALCADVASGKSVVRAVENLFDDMTDECVPSVNRARMRQLNAAAPVLSAISASPALKDDLRTVARMCQTVYELIEDEIEMLRSPRTRLNLNISNIGDIAKMIQEAKNIVVLSGAGVSVSCGIPDFRSKGGLYDIVLERFGLSDPQAIFDLEEFMLDPKLFYSFAKEVMPSKDLRPSPTHDFIAELGRKGKLLRNYSQNIDGLERRAGVAEDKVVLCHGSFLTATCMRKSCRSKIQGSEIASEVVAGRVPLCRECGSGSSSGNDRVCGGDIDVENMGVLKPDIIFFGESLPRSVSENLEKDVARADLLLVLGTSLQVAPVAKIPQYFKEGVPRILVNREMVGYDFDVELLGNCDAVVEELRKALGWEEGDAGGIAFRAPRRFLFDGAIQPST